MKKTIRSEGAFTPETVDHLRGEANNFLMLSRVPGPQAYSIVTVVDEVGCNILEHAKATFLELEIKAGLGHVSLLFRDDGVPFDPTAAVLKQAALMPGDSPERKLGLYMVASLGEGLRYERVGSFNELSINVPIDDPERKGGGLIIESEASAGPGKARRVKLRGKLDVFSFTKLKSFLEELAAAEPKARVALDVSQVDFIASSGWSVLLARRKLSKLSGGELMLCGMSADMTRVYASMKIGPLLPSEADLPSAVQRLEALP